MQAFIACIFFAGKTGRFYMYYVLPGFNLDGRNKYNMKLLSHILSSRLSVFPAILSTFAKKI